MIQKVIPKKQMDNLNVITINGAEKSVTHKGNNIHKNDARFLIKVLEPNYVNNSKAVTEKLFKEFIDHMNDFLREKNKSLLIYKKI